MVPFCNLRILEKGGGGKETVKFTKGQEESMRNIGLDSVVEFEYVPPTKRSWGGISPSCSYESEL